MQRVVARLHRALRGAGVADSVSEVALALCEPPHVGFEPLADGEARGVVTGAGDALAGGEDLLIVVSSDMSHFHGYEEAQRIDADTCELILHKASSLRGEQACGAAAINGLMASAWSRKLQVSLLQACNSGDTAGQRDRVVGYAAFSLH